MVPRDKIVVGALLKINNNDSLINGSLCRITFIQNNLIELYYINEYYYAASNYDTIQFRYDIVAP